MKKTSFLVIIAIGILGLSSSIYEFIKGEEFSTYFWAGFLGIVLIGTALIDFRTKKKTQ